MRGLTAELPRSTEALVRRRAHELSQRAYQQYIEELREALRSGTLSADFIPFWEPAPGPRLKQLLDRVRHELDVARAVAAIVIP